MAQVIKKTAKDWAFVRGWSQIPISKVKKVRAELNEALGFGHTNRTSLYKQRLGIQMPSATQADVIEQVFRNNGITDIWGDTPYDDEKES